MRRKAITVKRRFRYCIFLIISSFLIICITLFGIMEYQKRELSHLLEVNRNVYRMKSIAKEMVDTYYNCYLVLSDENMHILDNNIKMFTKAKDQVKKQVLDIHYIRQIEDYVNMGDTLLSQVLEGKNNLLDKQVDETYQGYKTIEYTKELIDWYYEKVYYAMQKFNDNEQAIIEDREKVIIFIISFVCLVTLVEIAVMLQWFKRKVLEPISNVTRKAALFWTIGEDVPIEEKTRDELQVLSNTFDSMTKRIEVQIEELQEKNDLEKLLRESEIKAMQSRINPHFMFNTLNSCAQMAYLENATKTEQMLVSVSDYFRYNLKDCNYIVTMNDEIKNIKDYIKIQKMRFGKRLNFEVEFDEQAKEASIPALVIQPLVENAIIHGVGLMIEGGNIKVVIKKLDNTLSCTVVDNGLGMDRVKLEKIKRMVKGNKEELVSDGIGISNVYGRLNGYFHDELVFEVFSEMKKGTKIEIIMPFWISDKESVKALF